MYSDLGLLMSPSPPHAAPPPPPGQYIGTSARATFHPSYIYIAAPTEHAIQIFLKQQWHLMLIFNTKYVMSVIYLYVNTIIFTFQIKTNRKVAPIRQTSGCEISSGFIFFPFYSWMFYLVFFSHKLLRINWLKRQCGQTRAEEKKTLISIESEKKIWLIGSFH